MKKKILGSIVIVAIAAVAAFNVNFSNQDNSLSGMTLANVEALAQSENGGGSGLCSQYCTSSNSYHCHGQNSSMQFTCYYMRVK